jgi:hypothetical protein
MDSTGTRASMHASSWAAVQNGTSRFSANGRRVRLRSIATMSRISVGDK